MNLGTLVSNAKGSAGRSVRYLALRANVAASTVSRMQAGTVDPSVETLRQVLGAAGFELQIGATRIGSHRPRQLADLTTAWTAGEGQPRLEWTRWRGFLDELLLHPDQVPEAIYGCPPPSGSMVIDVLLAAIAEKLADDAGLPRPSWTQSVPSLTTPFAPTVGRPRTDREFPYQLALRGILIDTTSLWRHRETIGA